MAKKDEQPAHLKHLQDHAPTVLHHPEEDQTILYRWLRRQLDQGASFWMWVAGIAVVVVVASILLLRSTSGRTAEAEAWEALMLASGDSNPVDLQIQVGEQGLGEASSWALLRAAESRYREGFSDLPQNREAALPLLSQSQDLFEKALNTASSDSILRRMAALGIGRTLEARGDLEGATRQYESVVKDFPDTPEAKQAEELIRLLRDPEIIAFYNQFSSFEPESAILPPGETGTFDFPGLPNLGDFPDLPGLGEGATVPGTGPIRGLPGLGEPAIPVPPLTAPEESPTDLPAATLEPEAEAPPAAVASTPDNADAPEALGVGATPSDPSIPAGELPSNPFPDR